MSLEANKAAVKRYFAEALDGGRAEVLDEIMVQGCIAHFPGRDAPANRGAAARSSASSFVTTLHHLVAEDDVVVAHLTHVVTYKPGVVNERVSAVWTSVTRRLLGTQSRSSASRAA